MDIRKKSSDVGLINVMIVIDTKLAGENDKDRKSTKKKPAICTKQCAFFMTETDYAGSGSGSPADIFIKAEIDTIIRITCVSISNQLDHAVFVYGLLFENGAMLLNTAGMKNRTMNLLTVRPTPNQISHEPSEPNFAKQHIWVNELNVKAHGTGFYNMLFVVYGKPEGSERPILGYFQTETKVTVKPPPK